MSICRVLDNQEDVKISSARFFLSEFRTTRNIILLLLFVIAILGLNFIIDEIKHPIWHNISAAFLSSYVFFLVVYELPRINDKKEKIYSFSKQIQRQLDDLYELKFALIEEIKYLITRNEHTVHLSYRPREEALDIDAISTTSSLINLVGCFKPEYLPSGSILTTSGASPLEMLSDNGSEQLNIQQVMRSIIADFKRDVEDVKEHASSHLQLHLIAPTLYKSILTIARHSSGIDPERCIVRPEVTFNDMHWKGLLIASIDGSYTRIRDDLSSKYFSQFPELNPEMFKDKFEKYRPDTKAN